MARRGRLLPLLLLLALAATDVPELHEHGGDTPGIFDEECPTARLAAGTGAGVAAPVPDDPGAAPAIESPPSAPEPAPRAPTRLPAGARAPPIAG